MIVVMYRQLVCQVWFGLLLFWTWGVGLVGLLVGLELGAQCRASAKSIPVGVRHGLVVHQLLAERLYLVVGVHEHLAQLGYAKLEIGIVLEEVAD